jgi:hypothetical protein
MNNVFNESEPILLIDPVLSVNSILNSKFTITGRDINNRYNKSNLWTKKNALRELNQKRIKNNVNISRMKRQCQTIRNNKTINQCPHCKREVYRLTCAHVGERVSSIIDRVLKENPKEHNICILDQMIQDIHNDIIIVVCCDTCNKLLDNTN